jgi:hypothetical protein
MKTRILISLFLILYGCKQKEEVDPGSYFTVNGQTIMLQKGYMYDFGSNTDLVSRDFDIVLVTEGINYNESNKEMEGTGSFVYLDLNVNSTEKFEPGTFQWNTVRGPDTFIYGFAGITCSLSAGVCDYEGLANGGSVMVEISGKSFIINFTMTLIDGQTATGYFKGPIAIL